MKYLLAMILCAVSLCVVASVAAATPSTSKAVFQRLSEEASATLGESRFACLAPVWESQTGHRSLVSDERSVRIGLDLLITARRALPAARRLLRANRSILTVEVVGRRYSLASMRHLARVVRGAMAAFPSASVGFSPFEEELPTGAARAKPSEPPCAKVEVELGGMPQAVIPGGPPPSHEEAGSRAAAEALAARYGRMTLISEE